MSPYDGEEVEVECKHEAKEHREEDAGHRHLVEDDHQGHPQNNKEGIRYYDVSKERSHESGLFL